MSEEIRTCLLCGSDRSVLFDQREFRGQNVTNRLCLNCGLVYQSPRMTESESIPFYTDQYRILYEGSADPTSRNLIIQQRRAESLYMFSRSSITTVRNHLDIGCSVGLLLQYFHKVYCCHSVGIEPNEVHRMLARKDGLPVYATLDELGRCEKDCFDLISMAHVLEHLPDAAEYLTRLRESFLAPDGWLLIEVPNLYAHDSFEIAHLISYSPHILQQVLEKAGFYVRKSEQHGRPRSRLLPLYISLLAQASPATTRIFVLRPEKLVKAKRRLGMIRRRIFERLFPKQTWS